jgi:hypothetical protein
VHGRGGFACPARKVLLLSFEAPLLGFKPMCSAHAQPTPRSRCPSHVQVDRWEALGSSNAKSTPHLAGHAWPWSVKNWCQLMPNVHMHYDAHHLSLSHSAHARRTLAHASCTRSMKATTSLSRYARPHRPCLFLCEARRACHGSGHARCGRSSCWTAFTQVRSWFTQLLGARNLVSSRPSSGTDQPLSARGLAVNPFSGGAHQEMMIIDFLEYHLMPIL